MSLNDTKIPAETARHVLWTFGREGGYRPGSFTQRLIELIAHADAANLARLAQAYPAEAEAVRMAQYDEDGVARLYAIATGEVAA